MNGNIFARLTGTKRTLLALLASSAMLTAGCANMATTAAPGAGSLATSATLGGQIHGGNQPVSGATVTLYYAAQSLYAAPILAATTTSASDGTGSFHFIQNSVNGQGPNGNTFSCPSTGASPLVYVVAKGGNTLNNGNSNVHNDAAAFIGIYGICSQLSNAAFLNLSEVTTVATMAAVQQFFDPSNDSISADGTGQQYNIIVNVPNTIARLANVSTGTSVTSTVIPPFTGAGSNGVAGVTVTATPETSKLNALANILAACVNNAAASATACNTLFANATPPNPAVTNKPGGTVFAPPTDVLQAIYYILTNPTNGSSTNLQNIFNLSAGIGAPYQPSLATPPSDWTIAINYASASTCGTSSGNFINQPYDINIDDQDNIWIANSQPITGNLSQLTKTGAAATCVFLSGGSNGGATIDSAGNVWLATAASDNIYRYSTGLGVLPQGSLTFPTAAAPLGVTADGLGNVYFTAPSSGSLYQIPGAATTTTAVTPTQISIVTGPNPIRLFPDFQGNSAPSNIWMSTGFGFVSRVSPSSNPADPNYVNGFSTTTFNTGTNSYGLTVTHNNDVFVSSGGSDNYVTYLTAASGYLPAWTTASGFAGIANPTGIAIDGRNNVWVPNNANRAPLGLGSVSEISAAGNALSPTSTGFMKDPAFLSSGRASAVDQAGNVWIVGDGPSYLTEIVGAGVPMYQPYAKGLTNGRFQTIP